MYQFNQTKEFLFKDDRSFKSCHASTIIHLSNGEMLIAWFGGTMEGHPDVDIWCARKQKGKWSEPFKICSEEGMPHWNPVFFEGDNGIIYLYYKVGQTIPKWSTKYIQSTDGGNSWSAPNELVKGDIGGRGPVRSKSIILENGTWLAPASIEGGRWNVFVDRSIDQGITWEKSDLIKIDQSQFKGEGIIQPTLWESDPGQVHMLIRSSEEKVYRSDSSDDGETWCEAYPIDLPNNNSGIDLVKLDNGLLALVYNPVAKNWGPRTPLTLSFSSDNGESWGNDILLETGEGEFSYPAIVSRENQLHISYTWNRERIVYVNVY